jgi:hypothetical protein
VLCGVTGERLRGSAKIKYLPEDQEFFILTRKTQSLVVQTLVEPFDNHRKETRKIEKINRKTTFLVSKSERRKKKVSDKT